jgi:hypothetical protein
MREAKVMMNLPRISPWGQAVIASVYTQTAVIITGISPAFVGAEAFAGNPLVPEKSKS